MRFLLLFTIIVVAQVSLDACPLQCNNDGTASIYFEDAEQHKSMLFPPGITGPIIDPLYAKPGPVTFIIYVQDPATQEYKQRYKVQENHCADGPLVINYSSIEGKTLTPNDRFTITELTPVTQQTEALLDSREK